MKIHFKSHYLTPTKNTVECILSCTLTDCNELIYISNYRGCEITLEALPDKSLIHSFAVKASAKCDPDDVYNLTKGKRIAESRATIKAMKIIYGILATNKDVYNAADNKILNSMAKTNRILNKERKHLEMLINNE